MTLDELIRALEKAGEGVGDLASVVLEDTSGCVYGVAEVYVSEEHGTVTLVAANAGHFD
jgi:hypothetical protein